MIGKAALLKMAYFAYFKSVFFPVRFKELSSTHSVGTFQASTALMEVRAQLKWNARSAFTVPNAPPVLSHVRMVTTHLRPRHPFANPARPVRTASLLAMAALCGRIAQLVITARLAQVRKMLHCCYDGCSVLLLSLYFRSYGVLS